MVETSTRLHVVPLNPELLRTILDPAASKAATNISYHSVQTFPEKSYGFIDLPAMEAEKVKKRLNGAILKGKRIKVEDARPNKRQRVEEDTAEVLQEDSPVNVRNNRERKQSKADHNVVRGHELSPERKIKRGWTETKSEQLKKNKDKSRLREKSQAVSKFSDKEEMLFRTEVPGNKARDQGRNGKRRDKVAGGSDVVHEFEKSTSIPSFLRTEVGSGRNAIEYEDGKGWLDQDGEVVERENIKATKRRKSTKRGLEQDILQIQPARSRAEKRAAKDIAVSASEHSSSDQSPDEATSEADDRYAQRRSPSSAISVDSEATSTSGSSESTSDSAATADSATAMNPDVSNKPTTKNTPESAVHPLEALFKKPSKPASSQLNGNSQDIVKPSLEIQTSFSFFNADDDEEIPPMPMTPFSSQDVRHRESRSAAPTPDTAHPSRMSSIFDGEASDGELSEMDDSIDRDAVGPSTQQQSSAGEHLKVPTSDFEKQFWEKRGENNRAWKARRRAVLKEKRQRENRARRPKNW